MGCLQSKPAQFAVDPQASQPLPGKNEKPVSKGLDSHERQKRLEAPEKSESFKQSDCTITYAWVTQRGFYPETPDKDNQDNYSIATKISEEKCLDNIALFGVYDGHGQEGHICSQFVSDQVKSHILYLFYVYIFIYTYVYIDVYT
jgi:hypothetical protein